MQKFAAELAWFHTSIHKAAVGGKPVYRIRVAGFHRGTKPLLCVKKFKAAEAIASSPRTEARALQ
jgi:hypothetical protein